MQKLVLLIRAATKEKDKLSFDKCLDLQHENPVLREKLQALTEVQNVARHPALLTEVTRVWPNSIRVVGSPHPIGRYTCLMHVFDFAEKPEYIAIAGGGSRRVFAGANFAQWLIERGLLIAVSRAAAQEGETLFYFREGKFKHAGLWRRNRRVLSKWGVGHLYDHGLFEVPMSYGTDISFYKRQSYKDVFELFRQFAEEEGTPAGILAP
jgi:hypothetical protein